MATLKLIENGIKKTVVNGRKRRVKRRRSNPVAVATKSIRRRNPVKRVTAKRINGRRRRNGIGRIKRSNGIFGTGSAIVKKTLTLTGGAVATNLGGNWIATLVSPYLAQFGLGQYTNLITQALVAQFGVPYLAKLAKQDGEMARLGGFLSVTLTALNQFFPQFSSLNPFTANSIVVNPNGQVALTGSAAQAVLNAAQADTSAKVGGFLAQLNGGSAGSGWVNPNEYTNFNVNSVM